MKKKLMGLLLAALTAAALTTGCAEKDKTASGEASQEVEEVDVSANSMDEDAVREEGSKQMTEEEKDVSAEEAGQSSEAGSGEETEEMVSSDAARKEYTAEMIAASISNNHIKMTVESQGIEMIMTVCEPDTAVQMNLGTSTIELYLIGGETYLHGLVEDQSFWYKASQAEDLVNEYAKDTESGMKAEDISNIQVLGMEEKYGSQYEVVTADVQSESDGEAKTLSYTFYMNPVTDKMEYMIYTDSDITSECKIEEVQEIILPKDADAAQEVDASELGMQFVGLLMGGTM